MIRTRNIGVRNYSDTQHGVQVGRKLIGFNRASDINQLASSIQWVKKSVSSITNRVLRVYAAQFAP